jgi:hypothetical protein
MISDTALQEFIGLWREEFSEEISEEQAMEIAPKFLNLFDHIYRPVKKEWIGDVRGGLESKTQKQPQTRATTKD